MELPELSDLDVCEVLSTVVARVLGHLRRQGPLSDDSAVLEILYGDGSRKLSM